VSFYPVLPVDPVVLRMVQTVLEHLEVEEDPDLGAREAVGDGDGAVEIGAGAVHERVAVDTTVRKGAVGNDEFAITGAAVPLEGEDDGRGLHHLIEAGYQPLDHVESRGGIILRVHPLSHGRPLCEIRPMPGTATAAARADSTSWAFYVLSLSRFELARLAVPRRQAHNERQRRQRAGSPGPVRATPLPSRWFTLES